jgi:hypothetical protein
MADDLRRVVAEALEALEHLPGLDNVRISRNAELLSHHDDLPRLGI